MNPMMDLVGCRRWISHSMVFFPDLLMLLFRSRF